MAHLECLVQENEDDTESWPYDVVSGQQASNSELFFSVLGGHGQFLANLVSSVLSPAIPGHGEVDKASVHRVRRLHPPSPVATHS